MGDTAETVDFLVTEIIAGIERHRGQPRPLVPITAWTLEPDTAMTPRDAFFADHERVPAAGRWGGSPQRPRSVSARCARAGARGRISASTLAALRAEAKSGTRIAYCGDPMLETVLVVCE